MSLEKMEVFPNECVTWDGDEFATFDDETHVEVDVSEENFENCEIDEEKREEIRANLPAIVKELESRGLTVKVTTADWSQE